MSTPTPALVAALRKLLGAMPDLATYPGKDVGTDVLWVIPDDVALATLVASWVEPLEEAARAMFEQYRDAPHEVALRLSRALAALPWRKEE
jgi:hypothetical protein